MSSLPALASAALTSDPFSILNRTQLRHSASAGSEPARMATSIVAEFAVAEFRYEAAFVRVAQASMPVGPNLGVVNRIDANASSPDRLAALDPKLARDIESILQFLDRFNPKGADALRRNLRVVQRHFDAATAAASPNQANGFSLRAERIQFALRATTATLRTELDDGTVLTAERIRIEFSFQFERVLGIGQSDPLIFDLNDNGIETTTPLEGHDFDALATGETVRVATATGGDALLVLDRNGNGIIDDGGEWFGDQHGAVDGFAELARFDLNSDGRIDANDDVFESLRLFQDANLNGATDIGELSLLSDYRIASILLDAQAASGHNNGNTIAKTSTFEREDGSKGLVADVLLKYMA